MERLVRDADRARRKVAVQMVCQQGHEQLPVPVVCRHDHDASVDRCYSVFRSSLQPKTIPTPLSTG